MPQKLTAEVKGTNLILTIPMESEPGLSASGKTLVVASSKGNIETPVMVSGQPLIVGVNAYIRNTGYVKGKR
jgi:hypothetical protein